MLRVYSWALHSGITPYGTQDYVGIKTGSVACKISTLWTVLSLQTINVFIFIFFLIHQGSVIYNPVNDGLLCI